MLRKHFSTEGIALHLPDNTTKTGALESDVEPADSTKQTADLQSARSQAIKTIVCSLPVVSMSSAR